MQGRGEEKIVRDKERAAESKGLKVDRAMCIVCGACTAVCPSEALVIYGLKLELVEELCIACGLAELVCPTGALRCPKIKS